VLIAVELVMIVVSPLAAVPIRGAGCCGESLAAVILRAFHLDAAQARAMPGVIWTDPQ
jgi:hypothetical protein